MSTRILSRSACYILAALIAALGLLVLVDRSLALPSARVARAQPPKAADVVVTTCTTQELANVMNALSGTSGGTISFNCNNVHAAATIPITQASGFIVTPNCSYTIDGGSVITLTGNDANRIFDVFADATLTLTNITLVNGYSAGGDGGAIVNNGTLNVNHSKFFQNETDPAWSGGAIVSYGPLNIANSEFGNNKAGNGGAIYPRFAPAVTTISSSNFHDNQTTNTINGWGGAMLLWDGAPVSIDATNFISNTARQGGAVYVFANSTLTVSQSSLAFNVTTAGNGGGLLVAGTALVTGTTIYSNTGGVSTTTGGGGVNVAMGGRVTVNNSNLYHNTANRNGGAILNQGTLTVTNSDIHDNYSTSYAAGIHNDHGAALLNNVTLSGNQGNIGGALSSSFSAITLTHVTANNNFANSYGGGFLNEAGTALLNNVSIDNNTSFDAGGGVYNTGSLLATDSTINHNTVYVGDFGGGGLYNAGSGTTVLTHVTIDGNTAQSRNGGGGIWNTANNLTLVSVNLSDNIARYYSGGGMYQFTGTVQLINSTLNHNSTPLYGGGIYVLQGSVLVTSTTVSNNSAYNGGGIYNSSATTLYGSTLNGNTATTNGGGIYNDSNSATTLRNFTLSGNSATTDGGGLYNNGHAIFYNATLADNGAATGGALYLVSGHTTILTNTILAYSSAGGNCDGTITASKFTFSSDNTCALPIVDTIHGKDPNGLDPLLTALGNYGSPTPVHMLKLGSPAIDGIVGNDAPSTDQRGLPRPQGGGYDIGAVERQPTDSDLVPRIYLPLIQR